MIEENQQDATFEKFDYIFQKEILDNDAREALAEMERIMGRNKHVPDTLKLPFYVALTAYPELWNTAISCYEKSFNLTLQAQPEYNFLSKKREERGYRININTDAKKSGGILFEKLSFNAQVGILAHELAHFVDYTTKTNFQIVKLGIMFLSPHYRVKMERGTDEETIRRGFGWQLHSWADFAMYRSKSSHRYKSYKQKYYMNPKEILESFKVQKGYKNKT